MVSGRFQHHGKQPWENRFSPSRPYRSLNLFLSRILPCPRIPANLTLPVPVLTALQIGNASSIYISATQFDAPGDDRQNLNGEWVQLANRGGDTVLIAGWTLSDNGQHTLYTFPAVFLVPGESVRSFRVPVR